MEHLSATAVVQTVALLGFAVLVFWAGVNDVLTFTVPNRISIAVALLYPAYVLSATLPVAWEAALIVALAAFFLGFVLFTSGTWGGGDAKLFAAAALWAGPEYIVSFTMITTLAGGVMAIFIWLQHHLPRAHVTGMMLHIDTDPDLAKQPMPYAAAIAVGALYVAFTLLKVG